MCCTKTTAVTLAKANRSTLTILHVLAPFTPVMPEPYIGNQTWEQIDLQGRQRATRELAKLAPRNDHVQVLGPAPAFAAKRAGNYRAQIVLRGDPERVLDRVNVSDEWTVDVDPVTLLG